MFIIIGESVFETNKIHTENFPLKAIARREYTAEHEQLGERGYDSGHETRLVEDEKFATRLRPKDWPNTVLGVILMFA